MKRLPFSALSASDQVRFVRAIAGGGSTEALISASPIGPALGGPSTLVYALGAVGVVISASTFFVLMAGSYGELQGYGRAGVDVLIGAAVALFGFILSVVSILGNARRMRRPFAAGTYVFVSDLVQAQENGDLKIYALADAEISTSESAQRGGAVHHHIVFAFPGGAKVPRRRRRKPRCALSA